jgi:hypothetical protein
MRDLITKLLILFDFMRAEYHTWKGLVWERDLDAPYCCDGYECACGAMTCREVFRPKSN